MCSSILLYIFQRKRKSTFTQSQKNQIRPQSASLITQNASSSTFQHHRDVHLVTQQSGKFPHVEIPLKCSAIGSLYHVLIGTHVLKKYLVKLPDVKIEKGNSFGTSCVSVKSVRVFFKIQIS